MSALQNEKGGQTVSGFLYEDGRVNFRKIFNLISLLALLIFVLAVVLYVCLFIKKPLEYEELEGGIRTRVNGTTVTFVATAPTKHVSYSGGIMRNAAEDYYDIENGIEYRSFYIEGKAALWGKLFSVEENIRVSSFSVNTDGSGIRSNETDLYKTPEDGTDQLKTRINRIYYKNSDGTTVLIWSLDGNE